MALVPLVAACGSSGASGDSGSASQPSSGEWQGFEESLRDQADAGAFSGAVLVSRDGEPLVEQAYGLADREANRPNDTETRFNIGSVGKMFTGVAVAQLVEQGDLAFDDTVGEHLSVVAGLSGDLAEVTIDQLLTHTSGLGDFMRNGYPDEAKSAETATDLLPLIVSEPLDLEPGTRESYSNSGYVVLGAIVEAVTGQSYYDYVREHIFDAAGMTRTDWFPPGQDDDNTARGYMAADDGARASGGSGGASGSASGGNGGTSTLPPLGSEGGGGTPSTVTLPPGSPDEAAGDSAGELTDNSDVVPWGNPSGGAYSTIGDLERFVDALLDNELLGPDMTATVMEGKVAMSDGDGEVAYGFTDGTVDGVRTVGHGGGSPGVGAAVDIYPDLGYVVVILANYDGALDPVRDRTREILTS